MTEPAGPTLEQARRRLRELGYLEGRVERFVFRRAFAGRGGLFFPAVAAGALGGAIASVAALASGEPGVAESAGTAAALWLHLSVANLLPAGLLAVALGLAADRSRAPGGAALAAGSGGAAVVFLLWIAGTYGLVAEPSPASLLWGVPVAVAALLAAQTVRSGFLARAFAHSGALPRSRRRGVYLAGALAGILVAAAILATRRPRVSAPPVQPSPRTGGVVVIAMDGLGLDAPGAPSPGLFPGPDSAATGWWPAEIGAPPEIWTDLATGVSSERHAVRSLARVRPLGASGAVRPPFGTRWYLRGLAPALRLAASAPVSADDRRALAFWEVAASAGLPALAVGWWASGPWPGAAIVGNEEILAGAADGLSADRRARGEFRRRAAGGDRVRTVYLPGADILRSDRGPRAVALSETRAFLEEQASEARSRGDVLVLLAADSHPLPGARGRIAVLEPAGARPGDRRIRAVDVAPSILARAGIPPARDLPGEPVAGLFAPGTLDPERVPSYGPRVPPAQARSRESDREYLEKLKSLGYLE